jgi:hypothetical protein
VSNVRDLVDRAAAHGLLLSSDGVHLRVESVTGVPVPASLRSALIAQKTEILAFLTWRDAADELLLQSTRRLGSDYPSGCPLDSEEWARFDDALHAAFWSGNLSVLRRTLDERERFAREAFARFRRERAGSP